MEGWRDEEIRNKDLMAPCGLYCGTCGIYIATRDNNTKFKNVLGRLYGTAPEETECLGCMQAEPAKKRFSYCANCPIRDCIKAKDLYSCHQCAEWPCAMIENFPVATGRCVMEKSIPTWRQLVVESGDEAGSEAWARAECERYHCSSCGAPLFRGAQRCRSCKKWVADELDGSI